MLNTKKSEKEDLIRKLLNEGRTYREITQIAHSSPNEIARIRKKIAGENTETNVDMKNKSVRSQVFDLLQKGVPLIQIIIDLDIESELALKLQDEYLSLIKKEEIVCLLKDKNKLQVTLEIAQLLQENPHLLRKIKQSIDIQRVTWDLMAEKNEVEEDLKVAKDLYMRYDSQLEDMRKQILKKNIS